MSCGEAYHLFVLFLGGVSIIVCAWRSEDSLGVIQTLHLVRDSISLFAATH